MSEKLVVFFSRRGENYAVGNISEGNAEHIAKVIKNLTGADIYQIKTRREYSSDYMVCIQEAKQELEKQERPEIIDLPNSIDKYNEIFLCYLNRPHKVGQLLILSRKTRWRMPIKVFLNSFIIIIIYIVINQLFSFFKR